MTDTFPAVQPHGALQPIQPDVWFVTGSVPFKPLVRLARNMVVLRHAGELTLVNSVRLDEAGMAALTALGTIRHVVKIGVHGMDDPWYAAEHGAQRWMASPEGDATELVDGGPFPVPGVRVLRFAHTVTPEAALLLERGGGLLITCDSVQHWAPPELMSPAAKLLTYLMGFRKPAQIGPPWRKRQTPPGETLRPDFERLAALPFQRLIGGHGGLLDGDAAAVLSASIEREFGA
jgi:hypothetical protein